jgi:hypothetical protein
MESPTLAHKSKKLPLNGLGFTGQPDSAAKHDVIAVSFLDRGGFNEIRSVVYYRVGVLPFDASHQNKGIMTEARLKIILNDEDVRKIEKAGDVSLDDNRRLALCEALDSFAYWQREAFVQRGKKAIKRHLEKFIQNVHELHDSLKDIPLESPDALQNPDEISDGERLASIYKTAFYYADIKPKDFIFQLFILKSRSAFLREQMSKNGRPLDDTLSGLLGELADVYLGAGGASVKVSRFNKKRTSRFIDFAWEAISHLPKLVKQPITKDALAARWEKELASQKKPCH